MLRAIALNIVEWPLHQLMYNTNAEIEVHLVWPISVEGALNTSI